MHSLKLLFVFIVTLLVSSSFARLSNTIPADDANSNNSVISNDGVIDSYQPKQLTISTHGVTTVISSKNAVAPQLQQHRNVLEQQQQKSRDIQQDCGMDSITFELVINLDSKPTETSYTLTCDNGQTYLQTSYSSNDANTQMNQKVCLPGSYDGSWTSLSGTCIFHISDAGGDGTGAFDIYEDGNKVHSYPGGMPFIGYDVCLGMDCDSAMSGGGGGASSNTGGGGGASTTGGGGGGNEDASVTAQGMVFADYVDWDSPCPEDSYVDKINKELHPEFFYPKDLTLTLTFDANPKQVGYFLMCDGKNVWKVPTGTFGKRKAFQTITEYKASIASDSTCIFTMYDTAGDGLMDARGYRAGSYTLTYGTMQVANYVASSANTFQYDGSGGPYKQCISCFGPRCGNAGASPYSVPSQGGGGTTKAMSTTSSNTQATCTDVSLVMTTDEFPTETGYTLVCSGETLWDVTAGAILSSNQFSTISDKVCVASKHKCCKFTVTDTYGDGIISPQQNIPGSFELRWNRKTVALYDGSNSDAKFKELSFDIGTKCS